MKNKTVEKVVYLLGTILVTLLAVFLNAWIMKTIFFFMPDKGVKALVIIQSALLILVARAVMTEILND